MAIPGTLPAAVQAPGTRITAAPAARPSRPLTWSARLLSAVFCPPVVVVLIAITASQLVEWGSFHAFWPFWYVVANGLAPTAVVVALWRADRISDLDVSRREQRLIPVLVGLAGAGLSAGLALLAGADRIFLTIHLVTLATFLVLALITLRFKVSVHSATMASWAVLVMAGGPVGGVVVLAAAIATAWSRVWLGRHQKREVFTGLAVGLLVPAALLLVLPLA